MQSTHQADPQIGGVFFGYGGLQPRGFTGIISDAQVRKWIPRAQQIFLAELTAVPLLLAREAETIRGEDCIFFVDNEAAVASLVRVSSVARDAAFVVQVVHALLTMLHTRCWFEWVDTKSNPADGLSRMGLQIPQAAGPRPDWACSTMPAGRPWDSDENPWAVAQGLLACTAK